MKDLRMLLPVAVAVVAVAGEAQAQRRVTGVVTASGAGGGPIPAATVQVVGTTAGTVTNDQGQFSVTVPANATTLRVRRIGYQQRQIALSAGQTQVNVALERDVLQLEQVVVTGQTTTTERRNATTATAVVSSEQVTRAPAPSIEGSLQGKVLGANINLNSGAPGGGGQIQIRGVTSILGQSDPLFVVDGVIVSNASFSAGTNAVTGAARTGGVASSTSAQDNLTNRLSDLNPNEIESIEVLKSAAAAAIYGSRATNGVVVIRTKRGQAGAARFGLLQRVGTQNPLRLPGQRRFTSLADALSVATSKTDSTNINGLFANGTPAYQNFQEQLYGNRTPAYETLFSASGGSEATTYRLSASQKVDQGIALNTNARLQTVRANLSQSIGSRITADVGLNVVRNAFRRGISNNDNTGTSPLYIFAYTPSVIDLKSKDANGNFVRNPFNCPTCSNPFETFERLQATEDVTRGLGNFNVAWTAVSAREHRLVVSANGGFDRFNSEAQLYSPGNLQYESQDGLLGTALQRPVFGLNTNAQAVGTYTFTPGSLPFTTTLSAGGSAEDQRTNALTLRGQGLLPGVPLTSQGQQDQAQQITLFRDQALFANAQVSAFQERLNLTAGVRADRSSANGDPSKFYNFPRVSASYRFPNLLPQLDAVKLRAGYGQTGNRPNYGARDVVLGTGTNLDGRATLIRGGAVGNPTIRPETLNEREVGADITALGGRLNFEATYFDRTITDLLLQPATAPSTGFNSLFINAGELKVLGSEFGLNAVPVQTRNFTWTSNTTFQRNAQWVNNLPATVPAFNAPNSFGAAFGRNRVVPGVRASKIWGNAPVRVEGGKVVEVLPVGTYAGDSATRARVSAARDTIIGDANPEFQMFFTNAVTYGRVSLSALVDWRKGGDVVNMTNNLFDEGGQSRDYTEASPLTGQPLGAYRYSAWGGGNDARVYVQNGGFVKLREVQLSYDVPAAFVRRVSGRISSARLALQGRNLAVWTNYWGAEPEVNNFGNTNQNRFIDLAVYPTPRQFFISADIGF